MRGDGLETLNSLLRGDGSPHVRGDGLTIWSVHASHLGSPPRAWGRLSLEQTIRRKPAVHPHVRGDGGADPEHMALFFGSPPRAWGRRAWGHHLGRHLRFTPTCVGTAIHTSVASTGQRPAVHPHVRGDGVLYLSFA